MLGSRHSRLLLAAIIAIAGCSTAARAQDGSGLPLTDMIRETKVALLKVQEKAEARNLPPLSTAVLELNTVQEIEGNGSVKFVVIELGGGPATESASTFKLTLVPPPPGSGSDVAAVELADRLAEGILSAARSLVAARQGKPPLLVSELVVSVKFGLARSGAGGLALQFPPFELKAGGKIKASEIQTITVTYAVPSEKK
jgi:hypothetical protein